MSGFSVDCQMSLYGIINDNFQLHVIASETIDNLVDKATRLYLQRNFPAIVDRNGNAVDGLRIRPRPDTPHVTTASGARHPQRESICNQLNTCGELWKFLCDLNNNDLFYPPYLHIELEVY